MNQNTYQKENEQIPKNVEQVMQKRVPKMVPKNLKGFQNGFPNHATSKNLRLNLVDLIFDQF